jgi:hypothetical protein
MSDQPIVVPLSLRDSDFDGVSDYDELYVLGTNPYAVDIAVLGRMGILSALKSLPFKELLYSTKLGINTPIDIPDDRLLTFNVKYFT